MCYHDLENDFAYSSEAPNQDVVASGPGSTLQSEQIPPRWIFNARERGREGRDSHPEREQRQGVSANLLEIQPAASVKDRDQWKMRKIIGRKMVDDEIYYQLDWVPTWEHESEPGDAENLVNEYLALLKHTQPVRGGFLSEEKPKSAADLEKRNKAVHCAL